MPAFAGMSGIGTRESNLQRLIFAKAYNVQPFGGNLPRFRNLIASLTLARISTGDR
jgi:hypothetical protein